MPTECPSSFVNNPSRCEARASADQYSDDSDSEIFWVKRRSSLKGDKRSVNVAVPSKNSEHQVSFYHF